MRWANRELEVLDGAVAEFVPQLPVALSGQWETSKRRTYQSPQSRPGVGPFVDVVDLRWRGALVSPGPIVAVAFLATAAGIYWAKSEPARLDQPVDLSIHAHADHSPALAMLAASVGGAFLPAVQIPYAGPAAEACVITSSPLVTGRVLALATSDGAEMLVVMVPSGLVRTGRNRLWRLREEYASALPTGVRALLMGRRSGIIRASSADTEK